MSTTPPTPKTSELTLSWHDRQLQAFQSTATEILFGGASEGGKSTFIRLALIMWCASIEHLQCYIFRKYYDDVVKNHMKSGNTSFPVLLKPWIDDGLVTITESEVRFVKTGSLITLKQMRTEEDAEKARGNEKHVAVLDEATQIQARHIANIRAWVRMPKEMKEKLPQQIGHLYPGLSPQQQMDLFPKVIHTANPEGASVGYYRRSFIMPAKPFQIWRAPEKDGGFLRQYIPSRIDDNPSADKAAQRTRLMGLGEARANALIGGVWDAPTGDFFKEYNDEVHTCHNFLPPQGWFTFRTFDWGTNEPFAVLWWCVSDGQEFNYNGRKMWFPRGALIAYREWYGCDKEDPAKGSGLRNQEIASGIISRSAPSEGTLTITDSLPFQDRGMGQNSGKYTIADIFAECGCPLVRGNTARVHGWAQLRDRLIGMPDGSGGRIPMIYFTESCAYTREYIPAIPYHPSKTDDAAEHGEPTHLCDCVRLACTTRPLITESEKPIHKPENSNILPVSPIIKMITSQISARPHLR